ncbi:unnamed protein product [Musa hybrid cultivar]
MSTPGDEFGDNTAVVRISSEVMVAAVVFLFMVVVFVFFLYLYAKHYLRPDPALRGRRSRARFVFSAADELGAGAPGRGLDAAVLRVLPVTVYRAADFKEGLECSVCLSELSDGEQARLLPKCNHGFHLECIDMWFHSHSTCPLCRSPVGAEPSTKPDSDPEAQTPPLQTLQESPVFPTNVLFWGDHDQVNAGSSTTDTVAYGGSSQEGPSSSSGRSGKPEGALVIEIPRRAAEDLPSPISPLPSSRMAMEETRSPVSATFRSLRRLWSHGRWTAGSSSSPRGGDIEQEETERETEDLKLPWSNGRKAYTIVDEALGMSFHALEDVLERLDLTGDGERALVIEAELLLGLLEQQPEHREAEVSGGDHEPPLLRSYVHRAVPLGHVRRRLRASTALLVGVTKQQRALQPLVDGGRHASRLASALLWPEGSGVPFLKDLPQPHDLPDAGQLPTFVSHGRRRKLNAHQLSVASGVHSSACTTIR